MIYHSTNSDLTDPQAVKIVLKYARAVAEAGGSIHASKGFYHGPAILVLSLPDGIDPSGLGIEGIEWKEVAQDGPQK